MKQQYRKEKHGYVQEKKHPFQDHWASGERACLALYFITVVRSIFF